MRLDEEEYKDLVDIIFEQRADERASKPWYKRIWFRHKKDCKSKER